MKIAFRADASLQIGSGHVIRCLTLADALRARGAQCHFISRAHAGHLAEVICQRGYPVDMLLPSVQHEKPTINTIAVAENAPVQSLQHEPAHVSWLGCTWQADAKETAAVLDRIQPDWLVVDHYALDQRWEASLAAQFRQLLVFDDLADRPHHCNLLLDQNLGRQPDAYAGLVPAHCQLLAGPHYALLRPEFASLRPYSLERRQALSALNQLLITMGGVDQPNATAQVLQALKTCSLPEECRITVIMGLTAPWLQDVRNLAKQMPWVTEVLVNVTDMAQRMANSDLAIGAAGGTSWERCCVGLPTVMVVLAENQQLGAQALASAGAAALLGTLEDVALRLPTAVTNLVDVARRRQMSYAACAITDGLGASRVLNAMGVVNG